MAYEWQKCRWGDLATLEYGKRLSNYESGIGSYRVFGTNGPIGWHTESVCDHATVVVGRKGAYRGVHYSPGRCFVIDTAFYLSPKVDFDMQWAYYELLTHDINSMDSGSAIPSTSRDSFYYLEVSLPLLPEQRAIAHILGTLDDKIDLNRKMNETLEAMAQALFKNWFVDFEPFRDQGMEDSPLGPIAKGWNIVTIDDIGNIVCGKTPSTRESDNYGGNIPFITIPDMHKKVFVTVTTNYLSEKGALTQSGKLLPKYAVCVSCIATPGLVALTSEPSNTNQQINSIICNRETSPYWCYLAMNNLRQEIITGGAGGSATLNLNKTEFSKMQTIKPNQGVMWKFHQIVEPLFVRVLANELESATLASIRDALLPKLLSGEIRVKDVERFAERAA